MVLLLILLSDGFSKGIMKSKRKAQQDKRKKRRRNSQLIWASVAVLVVGVLGYALWVAFRPSHGESIPIMADTNHVAEGEDPGLYNSDPPTSGPHYANEFTAGFYDEVDAASLAEYPAGYLVHNLEHGYVIFRYNCDLLGEQSCTGLKSQIQSVMDRFNGVKLIAFPWESLKVPVAMTSWGQLQRFEEFDENRAATFVERNRNRAPEPNAP
jgi:hypothetical protein